MRSIKLISVFLCFAILMVWHGVSDARAYEQEFVLVNKSFARDLNLSVRLYESAEKFVEPAGVHFYVVVPQHEVKMFENAFTRAQVAGRIRMLPIIMSEEQVYLGCGPHVLGKATKMHGWFAQQVVKMCFGKLGIAKSYLTLDSDAYFTKKFPISILFQNGVAKTYSPRIRGKMEVPTCLRDMFSEIKKVMQDKSEGRINFVNGFAMWSSDLIHRLEEFVKFAFEKPEYDFADLISFIPYEMQWYGNFVYAQVPEFFYPLYGLINMPPNETNARRRCEPTAGRPWHYGFLNRSDEMPYINPCGKLKTFVNCFRQTRKYLSFYLFGDAYRL